jgi:hypothetical protein
MRTPSEPCPIGQAELATVRTRRILGDQIRARRIDRLAMHRHRIGQVPRNGTRLAIAVGHDAVIERNANDAAGQIDGPTHGVGVVAADRVDRASSDSVRSLSQPRLLENAER